MLSSVRDFGMRLPKLLKPCSAKGSDPKIEGSDANVRPCDARKLSKYRLWPASSSRKGVKLPRSAVGPLNARPSPSTPRKPMLGGGGPGSRFEDSPRASRVAAPRKDGY